MKILNKSWLNFKGFLDSFTLPKHRTDQVIKFLYIRKQRDVAAISFYCFHILSDIHSLCSWTWRGKQSWVLRRCFFLPSSVEIARARKPNLKWKWNRQRTNPRQLLNLTLYGQKYLTEICQMSFVQCHVVRFFERKNVQHRRKNTLIILIFLCFMCPKKHERSEIFI